MTSSDDAAHRAAMIKGLRAAARFLEAHPDAPVPTYCADIHVSTHGTDDENQRAVDAAAAAIGADPEWNDTGTHYRASRWFGPVEYAITAITRASMARYEAESSYSGCVEPGSDRAVAA